ncbi:MAG: protein kinase [Verrucomicrobiota bacterium]
MCSACGSALEETSNGEFGCMVCLLRVGLSNDDPVGGNSPGAADRFGIYVIDRREDGSLYELGRGAMGVTYRAIDTTLQRKVALKIINVDLAARSGEARERFMRGARAAAALRHENAATIYQFGIQEETGQCFYAMELVEGETLEERVLRTGPLDARTTIAIALQIAAALTAAEKRGLVHRDLKPANLMLAAPEEETADANPKSRTEKVKVIDFGLAKALTTQADPMLLTRGGFVGTPAFASPEQFESGAVDVRSDIYSLGATLWFALTGKTPFSGRSFDEIRSAQQLETLPAEQLKAARIPSRLTSLLGSMLAREPAARPGTHDLALRLRRCSTQVNGFRKPTRLAAGLVLALAAVALFVFLGPRLANPRTIAVLPFANLSHDVDSAFFVNGIRGQIVARLSRISALELVADSSTKRFEDTRQDIAGIAAELGVATVLQGKIEKDGDHFRINVRLTNAKTKVDLWSQSYERTFSQITQMESEIAKHVADILGVKLSTMESNVLSVATTSNPNAYEAYLKGRYVWLQRTSDAYLQARDYFEKAIALDPNYAEAYVGLADVELFLGGADFDLRERKVNYEKARRACQRALELNPNLATAHASVGLMAMNYDWDWTLAEQQLRRAITLEPNNALIHDWYAEYLMAVGRPEESVTEMERARELDPLSMVINSDLGKMCYFARKYDEAEVQLKQTIKMNPDFEPPHDWLRQLYAAMGRFDDAVEEIRSVEKRRAGLWTCGQLAFIYGRAGRKADAEQMLEQIKSARARGTRTDGLPLVYAYIGVDDKDRAMACLEQDFESHGVAMAGLKSNPWFDPLRSDPRFVDLMRRVHLAP